MSNYPSFNDREFDLLKKICDSTAQLADGTGIPLTVAEANLLYFRLDGGNSAFTATSSTVVTVPDAFSLTSLGSIGLTAGGSNKSITLTPSGTGNVIINQNGGTLPTPVFQGLQIVGKDSTASAFMADNIGTARTVIGRRANGTSGSLTATVANDVFASYLGSGYTGSGWATARCGLTISAQENTSTTQSGTFVDISSILTGTNTGYIVATADMNGRFLVASGNTNKTIPAWGAFGIVSAFGYTKSGSPDVTATDSTSSGTVAQAVANSFAIPTFAASNATTFTDASTLYIAGAPAQGTNVTITNAWGLRNLGKTKLELSTTVGAVVTPSIIGGTQSLQVTQQASGGSIFPSVELIGFQNGQTAQMFYAVGKSGGTAAAQTTASANATVGGYRFYAYANSLWKNIGSWGCATSSTFSDSDFSSSMTLGPATSTGQATFLDMAGGNGVTGVGRGMSFGGLVGSSTSTNTSTFYFDGGSLSRSSAWGTTGAISAWIGRTMTDTVSSGTVATAVANSFGVPTFAANSATTFTNAANLYIAGDVANGTNVTLTNSYGLWNAGKTRLDGNITLNGTAVAVPDAWTVTSAGSIALTAGGSNKNISLSPTGTGATVNARGVIAQGNVGSPGSIGFVGFIDLNSTSSPTCARIGAYNFTSAAWQPFAINPGGGNVMLGTETDNGVDKLQVVGSATFSSSIKAAGGTITGTNVLNFGATALGNIGVSADTTAGILQIKSPTSGTTTLYTANALSLTLSGGAAANITGGAGNMTIVAGTGASRTLTFQTTTAGSAATTALSLAADQSATFGAGVTIPGTNTLKFGATALGTIGVSADTTAGILTLTAPSAGSISLTGKTAVTKPFITTPQSLSYASPTSVDVTLASCFTVTTVNATGSVTFNATAGGTAGQEMTILITNDATSAKTITFGTNFKSTGTLTASAAGRQTTISFKSDGTNWLETGRAVLTS